MQPSDVDAASGCCCKQKETTKRNTKKNIRILLAASVALASLSFCSYKSHWTKIKRQEQALKKNRLRPSMTTFVAKANRNVDAVDRLVTRRYLTSAFGRGDRFPTSKQSNVPCGERVVAERRGKPYLACDDTGYCVEKRPVIERKIEQLKCDQDTLTLANGERRERLRWRNGQLRRELTVDPIDSDRTVITQFTNPKPDGKEIVEKGSDMNYSDSDDDSDVSGEVLYSADTDDDEDDASSASSYVADVSDMDNIRLYQVGRRKQSQRVYVDVDADALDTHFDTVQPLTHRMLDSYLNRSQITNDYDPDYKRYRRYGYTLHSNGKRRTFYRVHNRHKSIREYRDKLQSASKKPASAAKKPASATKKPASASKKPASASKKPASASKKPASATKKPASVAKSASKKGGNAQPSVAAGAAPRNGGDLTAEERAQGWKEVNRPIRWTKAQAALAARDPDAGSLSSLDKEVVVITDANGDRRAYTRYPSDWEDASEDRDRSYDYHPNFYRSDLEPMYTRPWRYTTISRQNNGNSVVFVTRDKTDSGSAAAGEQITKYGWFPFSVRNQSLLMLSNATSGMSAQSKAADLAYYIWLKAFVNYIKTQKDSEWKYKPDDEFDTIATLETHVCARLANPDKKIVLTPDKLFDQANYSKMPNALVLRVDAVRRNIASDPMLRGFTLDNAPRTFGKALSEEDAPYKPPVANSPAAVTYDKLKLVLLSMQNLIRARASTSEAKDAANTLNRLAPKIASLGYGWDTFSLDSNNEFSYLPESNVLSVLDATIVAILSRLQYDSGLIINMNRLDDGVAAPTGTSLTTDLKQSSIYNRVSNDLRNYLLFSFQQLKSNPSTFVNVSKAPVPKFDSYYPTTFTRVVTIQDSTPSLAMPTGIRMIGGAAPVAPNSTAAATPASLGVAAGATQRVAGAVKGGALKAAAAASIKRAAAPGKQAAAARKK